MLKLKRVITQKSLAKKIAIQSLAFALLACSAHAAPQDELKLMLSARDSVATLEQLEKVAGGRELLIEELIKLREEDSPALIGMRAEKLLLSYSDSPGVVSLLEEDLKDRKKLGFARLIALNIDLAPSVEVRTRLATLVMERSKTEQSLGKYVESFKDSKHEDVRRLAENIKAAGK